MSGTYILFRRIPAFISFMILLDGSGVGMDSEKVYMISKRICNKRILQTTMEKTIETV